MHINPKLIGARIKRYRIDRQLSQEELGNIIGTISKHISNIENGLRAPSLDMLIAIANALEVSTDDILCDALTHPKSFTGNEIYSIFLDCNHNEKEMLIRTLAFLKALFSEFGI